MTELETKITEYLLRANKPLSYYQIDRKLSNDELHDFIPHLRKALNSLVSEGVINVVENEITDFYDLIR